MTTEEMKRKKKHEKNSAWYKANREKSLAASIAWQKSHPEQTREINQRATTSWRKNHPDRRRMVLQNWRARNIEKDRAQHLLSFAIQEGRIIRQPCEICGNEHSHAHHDDYSKPYEVRWLCPLHHKQAHREKVSA
jgi:hypothetical protein